MNLFSCCMKETKKQHYQLRTVNVKGQRKRSYFDQIDIKKLPESQVMRGLLKVKPSCFPDLKNLYKTNKFTDIKFPPCNASFGDRSIVNGETVSWKRIPEIVSQPQLIVDGIEPTDVIPRGLNKCYFLSTIAALGEKGERIQQIFSHQDYNENGIYCIKLKINGYIKDIIIDDYIPVDQQGIPIFCQPNQNQIWVMLLEKAWAKVKGSYTNISDGNPTQVFKAVTYAPSQFFVIPESSAQRHQFWNKLSEYLNKQKIICAGTKPLNQLEPQALKNGLIDDHFYTILAMARLKDSNHQVHQVIKLRNPWGKDEWLGKYCQNDSFWDNLPKSSEKDIILANFDHVQKENDGIFYIGFEDFQNYFQSIHVCHMVDTPFYEKLQIFFDGKHGQVVVMTILQEGQYIIELHQSEQKNMNGQKVPPANLDDINRATLVTLKVKKDEYQYIDGAFTYQDHSTTLPLQLLPGKYLIYLKIDPNSNNLLPYKTGISCYSQNLIKMKKIDKQKIGNFSQKMFYSYARNNKKRLLNKDNIWMSWKQFYTKGGFAYIAFGVDIVSNKKLQVQFDQKDFNDLNYVLKKPYKGKGKVKFYVEPGEQKIIVGRVKKGEPKPMNFPPEIQTKMIRI